MKDESLLPVWLLNHEDKVLHRRMVVARTNMLKVARTLRDYKPPMSEWMAKAAEIEGAAGILQGWIDELRRQAKEDREKGKE